MSSNRQGILLIFNINNIQKHYSECMQLIAALESRHGLDEYAHKADNVAFFKDCLQFMVYPSSGSKYPSATSDWVTNCERFVASGKAQQRSLSDFVDFVKNNYAYEFSYYLRIHSTKETEVAELFYYALMLQSPFIPKERIISYFIPIDESDNYGEFMRFSMFFRLLPEHLHRVCFAAKKARISRLDRDTILPRGAFLPPIEITFDTYTALRNIRKVSTERYADASSSSLSKWLATLAPCDCADGLILQLFRFTNQIIAEVFGGKIKKHEKKKAVIEALVSTINSMGGISALHYVIFGITINEYMQQPGRNDDISDWADKCMKMTMGLADGIQQVLENIVYHSENHKGIFAIRRHDSNSAHAYLSQMGYETDRHYKGEKSRNLQVLIADTNLTDTIIGTFLKSDKASPELRSAEKLIQLSDFFGEYSVGVIPELWNEYRSKNRTSCSGLPKFAKAMEGLSAFVRVRSSTMYTGEEFSQSWNRDYLYPEKIFDTSGKFIPGTQFAAIFPMSQMQTKRKAEEQKYSLKSVFQKTPEAFAKFLDYYPVEIDSDFALEFSQNCRPESQEEKDEKSNLARILFDEQFDKALLDFEDMKKNSDWRSPTLKPLFIFNMSTLCDNESLAHTSWCEPLCKGFLQSRWVSPLGEDSMYIILQSYSYALGTQFRSTAEANFHILKDKKFQICFPRGFYLTDVPDVIGENIVHVGAEQELTQTVPEGVPWEYFFPDSGEKSYIENKLDEYAEGELLEKGIGYKLKDTHIKLGSKVHIDTFYELASCFTHQEIARLIAFHLCRILLKGLNIGDILEQNKKILLYGYASYSRVVVNAMYEMLCNYDKGWSENIAFAIYQPKQTGITMSSSEEVYLMKNDLLLKDNKIAVIQVVPISSTLTTFRKMWIKLTERLQTCGLTVPESPVMNMTVLWVRNTQDDNKERPTGIEKAYWESVDTRNRVIKTTSVAGKRSIVGEPRYVLFKESKWADPLTCPQCYQDSLGLERPLIGTNASSTVPTQQYYLRSYGDVESADEEVPERIDALYKCVRYGHLNRGDNHFQYFIDMPKYFNKEIDEIEKWLKGLRQEKLDIDLEKTTVFIVSPQRPNNVEFSQYVNNYFYHGTARMIYIDSEKHFRSNVVAEYSGYLEEKSYDEQLVKFIFVDTAISTGNTFHRVSSLIDSLKKAAWSIGRKEFTFDKVFVLVNRLSLDSKMKYLRNPKDDYHAYVDVQISHMRIYGDSCIGCKLEQEAIKLHKLSATKQLSEYWQAKSYRDVLISHEIASDSKKPEFLDKSFLRMVCTHYATLKLKCAKGGDHDTYFAVLQKLFTEAMKGDLGGGDKGEFIERYPNIRNAICAKNKKITGDLIKSLSRPFLSFDYKVQDCIADILMFSVMLIIKDFDSGKAFTALIKDKSNICKRKVMFSDVQEEWRVKYASNFKKILNDPKDKMEFLLLLLKALSDMHMNFIYRKDVVEGVINNLVNDNCEKDNFTKFFRTYIRHIMRAVHNGSDERKGLWLEYMLKCYDEYKKPEGPQNEIAPAVHNFFTGLMANGCNGINEYKETLERVYHTLVVENGTVLFDGIKAIEEDYKRWNIEEAECDATCGQKCNGKIDKSLKEKLKELLKESHMWDFCRFLLLGRQGIIQHEPHTAVNFLKCDDYKWIIANINLMKLLSDDPNRVSDDCLNDGLSGDSNGDSSERRYKQLQDALKQALGKKLAFFAKHKNSEKASVYVKFREYFHIVESSDNDDDMLGFVERYAKEIKIDYLATGFYIGEKYILIKLEDNHDYIEDKEKHNPTLQMRTVSRIEPVYICIEHGIEIQKAKLFETLLIVRNVLMYRYQLVSWFEKDFNNDTMHSIARMRYITQLLTAEKAGNHENKAEALFLQERILRKPMPILSEDDVKRAKFDHYGETTTRSSEEENIDLIEIYDDFVRNYKRFGDSNTLDSWLLQYSYVNNKIGRLYRTLISDIEFSETKRRSLYRSEDESNNEVLLGREILHCFDEVVKFEIAKPYEVVLSLEDSEFDGEKIEILGLRRERYFELLVGVVQFHVEGKTCYNDDDDWETKVEKLAHKLRQYKCKTLSVEEDKKTYGYCADIVACILLDFCYSAMKCNEVWNKTLDMLGEDSDFKGGSAESYRFFREYPEYKCVVNIRRKNGDIIGRDEFDYLVLESSPVKSEKGDSGMSLPVIKWYIDGLWMLKYSENDILEHRKYEPNHKKTDETDENKFILQLPMLEKEREENE